MYEEGMKAEQFSIESEQSVIGAVLLDNNAYDKVAGIIKPEDFYLQSHREIWSVIETMVAHQIPIDVITLDHELSQISTDARYGGLAYLGDINQNTPSAANVVRYAKNVSDKAMGRKLMAAATEVYEIASGIDSVDAKVSKSQAALNAVTDRPEWGNSLPVKKVLERVVADMQRRQEMEGDLSGKSCGFTDIDRLTSGLEDTRLIIICGRPGSGKTTLALNMAMHVSTTENVLFVTLEMSASQLGHRMLASTGLVTMQELKNPKSLDEGKWADVGTAIGYTTNKTIEVDEHSDTTHKIASHARNFKRKNGLGLIVVDYIGLMEGEGENQNLKIANITRGLKMLAKELGIPVIALAQLSREVEKRTDKRPMMSDLRDSGAIEQDADIIIAAYRDYYYTENPQTKEYGEAIILKNRDGETGTAYLLFQGEHSRFRNATYDAQNAYKAALSGGSERKGGSRGYHG